MKRQQLLDLYFVEARSKLIDVAAFLDRVGRAGGHDDFRIKAFREALAILQAPGCDHASRILLEFSDATVDPIATASGKGTCGAYAAGFTTSG